MVRMNGNRIDFHFFRPEARQVSLVGDFGAGEMVVPMTRPEGGSYWRASLDLPPGHYRFCYRADGERCCDDSAFARDDGPCSTRSLVSVPAGT